MKGYVVVVDLPAVVGEGKREKKHSLRMYPSFVEKANKRLLPLPLRLLFTKTKSPHYTCLDDVGGRKVEDLGEYRVLVTEEAAAGNQPRGEAVHLHARLPGGQPALSLQREEHVAQLRVFVCAAPCPHQAAQAGTGISNVSYVVKRRKRAVYVLARRRLAGMIAFVAKGSGAIGVAPSENICMYRCACTANRTQARCQHRFSTPVEVEGSDERKRNSQALSPSYSPPSTMSNFLAAPSAARYCSKPLKSPRVAWDVVGMYR